VKENEISQLPARADGLETFCYDAASFILADARMADVSTFTPGTEQLWTPARRLRRSEVPAERLAWLLDQASLTQRLICACPGQFRVEVLIQRRQRPHAHEARALGLRAGQYALVRQVYLYCDDMAWVYARTVIPLATLSGTQRRLAYRGNRSLGAMLFADPTMHRGEVEIARIPHADQLFALATARLPRPPDEIWGRRSTFYLSGKPLLVSEFFLPGVGAFPS
jgi:chorismate--pyruvate lyase